MKFSTLLTAVALFTSHQAFAQCNTVMGGCTTEQTVNVAPHMRDNVKHRNATETTPAPTSAKQTLKNANVKNTNVSKNPAAKTSTKKM